MNNSSISFPLNERIGIEYTESDTLGIYWVAPNGVLVLNSYLPPYKYY